MTLGCLLCSLITSSILIRTLPSGYDLRTCRPRSSRNIPLDHFRHPGIQTLAAHLGGQRGAGMQAGAGGIAPE